MRALPRPRVILLAGITLLLLVTGIPPSAQAQLADSPWPMFRHDTQHTGRSTYAGPELPGEKWRLIVPGHIFTSLSVGPDGTIYAGSISEPRDNNLFAINPDGSMYLGVVRGTLTLRSKGSPM